MEIPSQSYDLQPLEAVGSVSQHTATDNTSSFGQPQVQDVASLNFSEALSHDDVRGERVQVLQSQIASGTYQVSVQGVADKLLSAMAEPV